MRKTGSLKVEPALALSALADQGSAPSPVQISPVPQAASVVLASVPVLPGSWIPQATRTIPGLRVILGVTQTMPW